MKTDIRVKILERGVGKVARTNTSKHNKDKARHWFEVGEMAMAGYMHRWNHPIPTSSGQHHVRNLFSAPTTTEKGSISEPDCPGSEINSDLVSDGNVTSVETISIKQAL